MAFDIVTAPAAPTAADLLAVGLFQVGDGESLDVGAHGLESTWLSDAGFEGKVNQTYSTKLDGKTLLAIGLGPADKVEADVLRRAAASVARASGKSVRAVLEIDFRAIGHISTAIAAQALAEGAVLGAYKYTEYKSTSEPSKLAELTLVGADESGIRTGQRIAEAVNLARDLVNGPPGRSTPKRLAEVATEVATTHGLDIKVLDENDIEREGLGGLRGVSMGSDEPPRLVELTYSPADPVATIALVGKGITFDSGGLSLKPPAGMMTMKTDMSGAAAVIAAMSVLGATQPKVKVIGIIAATENLPGPKATKPGDVLKARNGKTMEVLNTDAEGRLVLADALSLAVEAGVDAVIDLATLTGACVTALGGEIAGLMSNDDAFGDRVKAAADAAGEPVWPLPLPQRYRKHIDSDIADIKNIGASGGAAGALTAGLFLKEFVGETPWVHLDIAGPARSDSDDAHVSKGGTGFGVRTLIELVNSYE